MATNKLGFVFSPEKFSDFLKKLKDLASIDECIKIKIDKEMIFMYSIKSDPSSAAMVALKSFTLNTADYIQFNEDYTLDYVISNSPKLIKSLNIFMIGDEITDSVKLDIVFNKDAEAMHVRSGIFTSGKLKISCIGSELFKIRDVSHETLESRLDPDYSQWNFVVNKSELVSIKKLSSIYTTESSVIEVTSIDGTVTFNEGARWELDIAQSEDKEYHKLTFIKKYLSNIDENKGDIIFYVYDTFILVKDDISNLMLSYEQSWSD